MRQYNIGKIWPKNEKSLQINHQQKSVPNIYKQGSKFDQMGRAYKQVSIQYNCTKFYSFILLISCYKTGPKIPGEMKFYLLMQASLCSVLVKSVVAEYQ